MLVAEAGDTSEAQRKGNVRHCLAVFFFFFVSSLERQLWQFDL
jgi:hypothetical protein